MLINFDHWEIDEDSPFGSGASEKKWLLIMKAMICFLPFQVGYRIREEKMKSTKPEERSYKEKFTSYCVD
ncbi:hypothetical protein KTC96_06635 [Clostridium estertheticum]|uniref:hypothetical protein n=1 Tax=Clostridium estertheticum TaxID=238834 RepID=UPI001C7D02E6|nr:hypothetical protein [Clostridium estertheticum]MBX4261288.1 hypothetical protein [Clostridium estertheticum]WLC71672.1 hypothetical protein KTC96_06635 [Clostridium estertheticum]